MSKKKKKNLFPFGFDNHHLFYTKMIYNTKYTNKLREHPYCKCTIPKGTLHHNIHKEVRYVPVPREISAKAALEELEKLKEYGAIRDDDSIIKRLKTLICIFDGCDQPTADALKKQLAVAMDYYNEPP